MRKERAARKSYEEFEKFALPDKVPWPEGIPNDPILSPIYKTAFPVSASAIPMAQLAATSRVIDFATTWRSNAWPGTMRSFAGRRRRAAPNDHEARVRGARLIRYLARQLDVSCFGRRDVAALRAAIRVVPCSFFSCSLLIFFEYFFVHVFD